MYSSAQRSIVLFTLKFFLPEGEGQQIFNKKGCAMVTETMSDYIIKSVNHYIEFPWIK